MLLSARDEETGERHDRRQLRDEVMTMLLAGHETTSLALAWTYYLLSQHPDVEQRIADEVERVIGDRAAGVRRTSIGWPARAASIEEVAAALSAGLGLLAPGHRRRRDRRLSRRRRARSSS